MAGYTPKIILGIYGLPQAGKLANDLLQKRLSKSGYYSVQFTPGLWRHAWRPITFTLVVDDFGIKFTGDTHAHHLIKAFKDHYKVTIDWKGELFVGIKLKWDYDKCTLDMHVPNYVLKALHKFQHPTPSAPQHAPAKAEQSNTAPTFRLRKKTPQLIRISRMNQTNPRHCWQLCLVCTSNGSNHGTHVKLHHSKTM